MLRHIITTIFSFFLFSHAFCQQINLDEIFDDWDTITTMTSDPEGDTGFLGTDFLNLWVHNDDKYIYLSFEMKLEIILQDPNQISLYIDVDDDITTGIPIGNLGADITYYMGSRFGEAIINGNSYFLEHIDLGYVSLPTVSSTRFELKINRSISQSNNTLEFGNRIKVLMRDEMTNGDQIPDDDNGMTYNLNSKIQTLAPYNLEKEAMSDLRVLSYNVERDAIFENGPKQSIERIIRAIEPDIIAFQEIYDHGATSTANLVEEFIDNPDLNWYSAKVEPDIIMVSQYPIIEYSSITGDGNGAFLIRKGGQEYLFINVHLPCCNNNAGRVEEVANIVQFVDDLKNGLGPFALKENTPIIILGDTNFVGHRSQVETLIKGLEPGLDWGTKMKDSKPLTTGEPMSISWYNPFSDYCPGRLDYILYSGSVLEKKNSFILYTPSLSNELLSQYGLNKNDSTNGSDHLATVADFVLNSIVSTEENTISDGINIYPNPVSDLCILRFKNDAPSALLKIYNYLGQLVESQISDSDQFEIDMTNHANGSYFFTLKNGTQRFTGKIMKI